MMKNILSQFIQPSLLKKWLSEKERKSYNLLLLFGFILTTLFWQTIEVRLHFEKGFLVILIYSAILFLYTSRISWFKRLHFPTILFFGILFRLFTLYPGFIKDQSSHLQYLQSKQEWVGFFFKNSFNYVQTLFPLFELGTLLLEGVLVYAITLVLRKRKIEYSILILYLWNPLVVVLLYHSWNPFIIWNVLIIASGSLIIYNKRFLGAVLLGLTPGFHDISFFFILLSIRKLKGYIFITLLVLLGLFLSPGYQEYMVTRTLYSDWLKEIFLFLKRLSLNDFFIVEERHWRLFLVSFILTIIIWGIYSSKEFLNKLYYGLFFPVLVYPHLFSEFPTLFIVLAALHKNMSLLFLSVYLFMFPLIKNTSFLIFSKYFQLWQFAILFFFLLPSLRDFFKEKSHLLDSDAEN